MANNDEITSAEPRLAGLWATQLELELYHRQVFASARLHARIAKCSPYSPSGLRRVFLRGLFTEADFIEEYCCES